MKFRSIILQGGKTATGIKVPEEIMAGLAAGRRPPVRVTINGFTYRTSIGTVDGASMLPVSADVRQKASISGGEEVDIDIELDTQPREVAVPPDFAAALEQDPQARQFFEGLTYSGKQRFVLSIEGAKTAETRQRRIAKAVADLHERRI